MLLYISKYSRSDTSNVVRESSKIMDGVSMMSQLQLLHLIEFVLDTKK
jgi:hypothetical protein